MDGLDEIQPPDLRQRTALCVSEVMTRWSDDVLPLRSDNGNLLLDCRFPDGIDDPAALDAALQRRAGVVETGLFLGLADVAILAFTEGIEVRERHP